MSTTLSQKLPGNEICGLPQTNAHETDKRINNFIAQRVDLFFTIKYIAEIFVGSTAVEMYLIGLLQVEINFILKNSFETRPKVTSRN